MLFSIGNMPSIGRIKTYHVHEWISELHHICFRLTGVSSLSAGKTAQMAPVSTLWWPFCSTVTLRPLGHCYTQYIIAPTPGSDPCPFPPPRVSRMHDPQGVNTVLGLGHSFQLACWPISNNSDLIFFKSWVCVLILIIRVGEKPGDLLVQETEQCAWMCLVSAVWLTCPGAVTSPLAVLSSFASKKGLVITFSLFFLGQAWDSDDISI